jgi:hypothetical protein
VVPGIRFLSSRRAVLDARNVPSWWRGDAFNARESVGDNVVLSRYMSYVGGELGNEMKVIELPR